MPDRPARLIVLPPSHFCERARWGLDRAGVCYTEARWAAGIHAPLARRLAPSTTLPILRTGTAAIQGSGRILDWTGLPGGDPPLEQRFEERIGPLVRRYLYAASLGDRRSPVRDALLEGVPPWQVALGRLVWPATRRAMIASMDARAELVPSLAAELDAELGWFDGHLSGRPHYLVGDALGRADITAASLLAPLARPAALPLYRRTAMPPDVEETLRRWSARPALRWVVRTYAEHRRAPG